MNIREKLVRVDREIDAIAGHDDADAGVVIGALEKIKAGIDVRIAAINERVAAEVAEMTADEG